MPGFVRDLQLHVHTRDGTTSVEAPPDVKVGKFVDDLRTPLHLASGVHICDREGKRLDLNRSLGENGVGEGDDLYFREAVPGPTPPPLPTPGPSPIKKEEKALIRCDNGHYYDPKRYPACPYCNAGGSRK
jgi:hypothetical protein